MAGSMDGHVRQDDAAELVLSEQSAIASDPSQHARVEAAALAAPGTYINQGGCKQLKGGLTGFRSIIPKLCLGKQVCCHFAKWGDLEAQ